MGSFTGQETFFSKNKIVNKIEKIKNMKEDLSLDDQAAVFSSVLTDVALTKEELLSRNIVFQMALDIYEGFHGEVKVYPFVKILYAGLLESFLRSGEIGLEEEELMLQTMEELYKNFEGKDCHIVLLRKFGVAVCFLVSVTSEVYVEQGSNLVLKVNIGKSIEELKLKL